MGCEVSGVVFASGGMGTFYPIAEPCFGRMAQRVEPFVWGLFWSVEDALADDAVLDYLPSFL